MHRGLSIPEVLHQVMQWLSPRPISYLEERERARATLLNAALTCSLFSGPALDALWHSMDNLVPLFKLLPNFELSLNETMPSNIWGGITENHISIFNTYAARIKCYSSYTNSNNIHASAYNRILRTCGRSYLLPNLIYFRTMEHHHDEVLFLLSPRLQKLSLCGNRDNPAILLNSLALLSPNLIVLELTHVVLDSRCLSALCLLSQLEKLDVGDASFDTAGSTLDFLFDMSAQQTLRYLELEGSISMLPLQPSLNRDPVIFSVLKEIDIDIAMTMESITALLHCTRFPVLEALRIGLRDVDLEHDEASMCWRQFFDNIGQATTESFKGLTIFGYWDETSMELHLSDLPKLPLTLFSLQSLHLTINHCVVGTFIDAWPRLTKLSLPNCDVDPEMDFPVLITIALGLPQLEELEIPINGTVLPDIESIPLLFHSLHALYVWISGTPDAKLFVQAVDRLFPKLQRYSLWEEADSLLNLLHRIRRDDAMRLALGMSATSPVSQKRV